MYSDAKMFQVVVENRVVIPVCSSVIWTPSKMHINCLRCNLKSSFIDYHATPNDNKLWREFDNSIVNFLSVYGFYSKRAWGTFMRVLRIIASLTNPSVCLAYIWKAKPQRQKKQLPRQSQCSNLVYKTKNAACKWFL